MKESTVRNAPKSLRKSIEQEQATILAILNRVKKQVGKTEFGKYEHLFSHISDCPCHAYQADGTPCTKPESDCHDCQKALDDLSNLRQSLNHDFKLE